MGIVSDEALLAACLTCGGRSRPIQSPPCWADPPDGISLQKRLKANDVIVKFPWGGTVDIKQIFAALLFLLIKINLHTSYAGTCLTSVVVRCRDFRQSCIVVDAVSKDLSPSLAWQLCLFCFPPFYLPAICVHDSKRRCPSIRSGLKGS